MTDQSQHTTRINVGLEPDADVVKIKRQLMKLGAKEIKDPTPENPDLLRVLIPAKKDSEAFIEQAEKLPGVRYAEEDAWSFSI